MTKYVTELLQKAHEQLKKNESEYFKCKSKMLNCCLIAVSYEKHKCGIKIYGAIGVLNDVDTSIFCNDNRKEIDTLFGLK